MCIPEMFNLQFSGKNYVACYILQQRHNFVLSRRVGNSFHALPLMIHLALLRTCLLWTVLKIVYIIAYIQQTYEAPPTHTYGTAGFNIRRFNIGCVPRNLPTGQI